MIEILVEGMSGTGKSRAILNLDPATTVIIKPNKKDLPFPGSSKKFSETIGNVFVTKKFNDDKLLLKKINDGTKIKTVVIEDLSHFFSQKVMEDASKVGFQKWTDLAVETYNSIFSLQEDSRDDLYVILIGHVSINQNAEGDRILSLATPGKLLDNLIQIPSLVTYILHTNVTEKDGKIEYRFLTNKDGSGREAKSPEGCLELYEENDYAKIIAKIDKYRKGEINKN
jgi:hypothetical protein